MVEVFHSLVETGTKKKLHAFGYRRGHLEDISVLKLSGAGKVCIDAGIGINRHVRIITGRAVIVEPWDFICSDLIGCHCEPRILRRGNLSSWLVFGFLG